ncbi:hypothetical protein [Streptomyces sp. NPDC046805]|uniref:hypothetical protein n=1 Tax=Streptomyces sp. NPDC046805 TaxID=3155134 RepID=UPI0034002A11
MPTSSSRWLSAPVAPSQAADTNAIGIDTSATETVAWMTLPVSVLQIRTTVSEPVTGTSPSSTA